MPKSKFIGELQKQGLSLHKARAYCEELLYDGTIEMLAQPQKGNMKIVGFPGAIAREKEKVKNNENK